MSSATRDSHLADVTRIDDACLLFLITPRQHCRHASARYTHTAHTPYLHMTSLLHYYTSSGLTFKATGSALDIFTSQVFLPVFPSSLCGAPLLAEVAVSCVHINVKEPTICCGKTALWSRFWPGHKFSLEALWTWIGGRSGELCNPSIADWPANPAGFVEKSRVRHLNSYCF